VLIAFQPNIINSHINLFEDKKLMSTHGVRQLFQVGATILPAFAFVFLSFVQFNVAATIGINSYKYDKYSYQC
jgi:hypothetical protein